ncbi:hypothetical protein SOVF_001440 [Spinacia oleracea]|nr:hypothetical protein SOVF_001440 [Spinacia oleracea]
MLMNKCTGRGCCIIDLKTSLKFYRVNISSYSKGVNDCTNTMLINRTVIENEVVNPSLSEFALVPTVLEWDSGNLTDIFLDNGDCSTVASPPYNLICYCNYGYYGNPYLPFGCQVPRECKGCKQGCFKKGSQYRCIRNDNGLTRLLILLVLVGSIFCLMLCCLCTGNISCIYLCNKKRKHSKMKVKFFQKNGASMPIIHRDIKSSNIHLDNNFTVKIADCGVSRLVPMDQTQVKTLIQGTFGYLDPEYFLTSHLSEKSDIYSFGVVLVELLTKRKPISWETGLEDRNLAMIFISSVKNNQFFDILEPQLLKEASEEQLVTIAELVEKCLSVKGEDRPSMKDVAKELEGLMKKVKHPRSDEYNEGEHVLLSEYTHPSFQPFEDQNISRQLNFERDLIIEMSSPR